MINVAAGPGCIACASSNYLLFSNQFYRWIYLEIMNKFFLFPIDEFPEKCISASWKYSVIY